jgi:hypothetical protein
LLIVATVVSVAPPDPIITPPVPELLDPFNTTAPVPAAFTTVWLLVLPEVVISATALGALVWFEAVKETVGCDVYPLPPEVMVMLSILYVEHEMDEEGVITAVAAAPVPPPPEKPIVGAVDVE